MIIVTEREENEYGMLIPLSAVSQDGEMTIHVISEARDAAEWLDRQPADALTERETWEQLDRMLRPLAEDYGYEPDDGYVFGYSILFTAERGARIDRSLIRPDTRRVYADENLLCRTETVLDENAANCTIFGTVRNGELLSFANLNSDDGEVVEIGVETAPDEEGNGFASSNTAAITAYFLDRDRRVFYETEASNDASVAVARKVGLTPRAVKYHYVCFPGED